MATQKVTASGTPYTLTETPAKVVFGTTSPTITINKAHGTRCTLFVQATIDVSASEFAADRTVTLKLVKTNGVQADLASASVDVPCGAIATSGQWDLELVSYMQPVVHRVSAEKPDVIELWASIDSLPDTGEVTIEAAIIESQTL
jgi:hypothetical protein